MGGHRFTEEAQNRIVRESQQVGAKCVLSGLGNRLNALIHHAQNHG